MQNAKQQVRDFYDEVGWMQDADGLFQNSRYEDLRPVSRDYIHKCHLRVNRHLAQHGTCLLDAGSGPVQWPEYLTYSEGYRYRVCADISITALQGGKEEAAAARAVRGGGYRQPAFRDDAWRRSLDACHPSPALQRTQAGLHGASPRAAAWPDRGCRQWMVPAAPDADGRASDPPRPAALRPIPKRKKNWSEEPTQEGTFVQKVTPAGCDGSPGGS